MSLGNWYVAAISMQRPPDLVQTAASGPAHRFFYLSKSRKYLLVVIPTANDLETYRSVLIPFWTVHLIAEPVLFVLRDIMCILGILRRIHGSDREDCSRIVKQIPLGGVAPVFRLIVRRGGSEGGWTKYNIDLLTITVACLCPHFRIEITILVTFFGSLFLSARIAR